MAMMEKNYAYLLKGTNKGQRKVFLLDFNDLPRRHQIELDFCWGDDRGQQQAFVVICNETVLSCVLPFHILE